MHGGLECGEELLRYINRPDITGSDIDAVFGFEGPSPTPGERIVSERARLFQLGNEGFRSLGELDQPKVLQGNILGRMLDAVRAGKLTRCCPGDVPAVSAPLPAFFVPAPVGIRALVFTPWFAPFRPCTVPTVARRDIYTRGNNEPAQLLAQKAKTGNTFQYQTATFDVAYVAVPYCFCLEEQTCIGLIELTVVANILLTVPGFRDQLLPLMLVPVGVPSVKTSPIPGRAAPGPDVNVQIDTIDVPNPEQGNVPVQLGPAGADVFRFVARSAVPCIPGTYARRFAIVPQALAGMMGLTPGLGFLDLVFFIDVNLTVTRVAACALNVALETFVIEFRRGYDFEAGGMPALAGANAELPEVRPTLPDGTSGASVNTRNIAKRIAVDDMATDTAFPPK